MPQTLGSLENGAAVQDFGEDDDPRLRAKAETFHTDPVPVPAKTAEKPYATEDFGEDDDFEDEPAPAPAKVAVKVESPPPVPSPEPETFHKHAADILGLAAQWGIGEDEAKLYPREELRRELLRLNREARAKNQATDAPVVKTPEPEAAIDWGVHDSPDGEGKRPWKDDDLSPAIVKVLKDYRREIETIKAEVIALKSHTQTQAVKPLVEKVMGEIAKYGEFFGGGNPSHGTPEHDRVSMVVEALRTRGRSGLPAVPEKDVPEVIKRLFNLDTPAAEVPEPGGETFHPKKAAKADPEAEAIKEKFKNNTVVRPTNRNTPELPKGEERAILAARNKLIEKGITPAPSIEIGDDGFG